MQKHGVERKKMDVKETRQKKLEQSTLKAKSKMSKAEKKAQKKHKAQEFQALTAGTKKKNF